MTFSRVCIVVIWFMYQIHINQLCFPFQSANFKRKLGFHVVFSQVDFVRGVSWITMK